MKYSPVQHKHQNWAPSSPQLCASLPHCSLALKENVLEQNFPACTCQRLVKTPPRVLRGGQEIQGYLLALFVPILLLWGISSPCLTHAFLPFFTPPHFLGCSCSLLVPEVIFSSSLKGSRVRVWFLQLPVAVLCWDVQPPYPEPARKRRGRESLQPPAPAPSNKELKNSKQNTDCGGNWFWIRDLEREHSCEVTSVLLHKEIFPWPFQTSRYFSIHLAKHMISLSFSDKQVISLSI